MFALYVTEGSRHTIVSQFSLRAFFQLERYVGSKKKQKKDVVCEITIEPVSVLSQGWNGRFLKVPVCPRSSGMNGALEE